MRARLGIFISSFITLLISLLSLYMSIILLNKFALSYVGVAVSITLTIISVAAFLGREVALRILSIFYFILASVGILLALSLPPEGLLIFLPSMATATYLWRYDRSREGRSNEGFHNETEKNTFSPDDSSEETLFSK